MENIRNFCIISHIDHGKSTLADRFLELTGTIPKEKMRPQYLDMMDLEREKGITIKMAPARMIYHPQIPNPKSQIPNKFQIPNPKSQTDSLGFRNWKLEISGSEFILNLIDTPGHIDFSYEVSRSLAAVEGAILLVDAFKGIQAQTIVNLELAKKQNLIIIPVVNKIDLAQAKVKETKEEIAKLLNISEDEVFSISAKEGTNVEELLRVIIEKIPAPKGDPEKPFRALIFDSKYDPFKGIIAYVKIVDGQIKTNEKIYLIATGSEGKVKELGYFRPEFTPQKELKTGEIGYIATGIKEPGKVRVGDTITKLKIKNEKLKISDVEPLSGYQEPKPMVFVSFYPQNPDDFDLLKNSLNKLKLNDPALIFETETKEFLGRGFKCGFLGTLHAEIVSERLLREFNLNLVISSPSVIYKIIDKKNKEINIFSASDWPDASQIKEVQEPWAKLEILTPKKYLGRIFEILKKIESHQIEIRYLGPEKILLIYEVPLREIIFGFYDDLKGVSQGYASMNYEFLRYKSADLVKLEILIAGQKEENLSKIVPRAKAYQEGRKLVQKLKEILPAQLFSLPLQAVIEGKIIARETIRPKGKDVIAPLYGGDYTRKRKLLERQKLGKKELKEKGKVQIPQKVFIEMAKRT